MAHEDDWAAARDIGVSMQKKAGERSYTLRAAIVAIAAVFGLGLLGLGIFFLQSAKEEGRLAEEVESLPLAPNAQPGQRVLVDGTVSTGTPLLRDEFVAFQRVQRQSGPNNSNRDVTIEIKKQPFVLDTAAGPVRITNADYKFDDRVLNWAPIKRVDSAPNATEGGVTIFGFARSSPVVVLGTVEGNGTSPAVRAETIVVGPRALVLERLRASSARLGSAAPYLLAIAPFLLLYAFWDARRIMRA